MAWFLALAPVVCATPVARENLPLIDQHNDPAFANGGEFWCAPTSAASALIWLANTYNRPDVIPKQPSGARMTTNELIIHLAEKVFFTKADTGTTDRNLVVGLFNYLRGTPYQWSMELYSDKYLVDPADGLDVHGAPTFDDLYEEMQTPEDEQPGIVIPVFQRDLVKVTQRHAVVLQQIDDEKNALGHYPGMVMDPYDGKLGSVGFSDMDGKANIWIDGLWKGVYMAVVIRPAPEPSTLALVAIAGLAAIAVRYGNTRLDPRRTRQPQARLTNRLS